MLWLVVLGNFVKYFDDERWGQEAQPSSKDEEGRESVPAQTRPTCCRVLNVKIHISRPPADVSHVGIATLGVGDESCSMTFQSKAASCEPRICHSIVGIIARTDKSLLAWVLTRSSWKKYMSSGHLCCRNVAEEHNRPRLSEARFRDRSSADDMILHSLQIPLPMVSWCQWLGRESMCVRAAQVRPDNVWRMLRPSTGTDKGMGAPEIKRFVC